MSNIKSALKDLLKKAASDADFRAKALKDPAAALKEAGVELPAGQSIKFVEKIDEIVIALPPLGAADAELSDDLLEKAAGGAGAYSIIGCVDCGHLSYGGATPSTPQPQPPTSVGPRGATTVSWIL